MLERLAPLEREVPLSPLQKILLTTDGSVTRILAVLAGPVRVETVAQRVVKADRERAGLLGVQEGEELNYRVVTLLGRGRPLVRAVSYTPLKRLKPEFRDAIMRRDLPIGEIMARLRMEARREVRDLGTARADGELAGVFGVEEGSLLLWRNYHIIHQGEVLLNITETFPYEAFR